MSRNGLSDSGREPLSFGDLPPLRLSRRQLLAGASKATLSATLPVIAAASASADGAPQEAGAGSPVSRYPVELEVNGSRHQLGLDPRVTLLDALREHLALTGCKKGCDHGQCGACTVLVGERRVLSCLTLAVAVREPVMTIEGLEPPPAAGATVAGDETLHPMQQAFIDHDAFQCGYCTPGQILSAVACVREGHASSAAEIREYMSGNLCRCAAYPNIVAAIQQAAARMGEG